MDENEFANYAEWAEQELLWGKGMFNWCRAYTKEEWQNHKQLCDYDKLIKTEIPY